MDTSDSLCVCMYYLLVWFFLCVCVCLRPAVITNNEVDARPFVGVSLMVYLAFQRHRHQSLCVFMCVAYWEPIKAGRAPVLSAVFSLTSWSDLILR